MVLGDPGSAVWGGSPGRAPSLPPARSWVGRPLPVCCPRSQGSSKAAVTVTLLGMLRLQISYLRQQMNSLVSSHSGSSLTLSCRQLHCEEGRLSTQAPWRATLPAARVSVAVTPLGAGWMRLLGLTLLSNLAGRDAAFPSLGKLLRTLLGAPSSAAAFAWRPFPSPVLAVPHPCPPSQASAAAALPSRGWGLLRRPGRALPADPDPRGEPAPRRLPLAEHLPNAHGCSAGIRADLSPWQKA